VFFTSFVAVKIFERFPAACIEKPFRAEQIRSRAITGTRPRKRALKTTAN
jgi:hypothetical protein